MMETNEKDDNYKNKDASEKQTKVKKNKKTNF